MARMHDVFETTHGDGIVARIEALRPDAVRQWGKMTAAQMLAHCAIAVEAANGERPMKQIFLGKLLGPFVRKTMLGPKPYSRGAPTGRLLVVADARDFATEQSRLLAALRRLRAIGPDAAAQHPHGFLGRMTGEDWGRAQWKHLDHHLRQFGG
jgi:hypothetical protein